VRGLYVEYAGGGIAYGIIFRFSLLYAYGNLECVRIHVICRVNQTEYGIRILVAASQEYVNTYSTRRVRGAFLRVRVWCCDVLVVWLYV